MNLRSSAIGLRHHVHRKTLVVGPAQVHRFDRLLWMRVRNRQVPATAYLLKPTSCVPSMVGATSMALEWPTTARPSEPRTRLLTRRSAKSSFETTCDLRLFFRGRTLTSVQHPQSCALARLDFWRWVVQPQNSWKSLLSASAFSVQRPISDRLAVCWCLAACTAVDRLAVVR